MIDAYWSGYDDYKRGRHFADNPYNYDTDLSLHMMWSEGYMIAYEEVMKRIEANGDQAADLSECRPGKTPKIKIL
jgi:hypothetical protein